MLSVSKHAFRTGAASAFFFQSWYARSMGSMGCSPTGHPSKRPSVQDLEAEHGLVVRADEERLPVRAARERGRGADDGPELDPVDERALLEVPEEDGAVDARRDGARPRDEGDERRLEAVAREGAERLHGREVPERESAVVPSEEGERPVPRDRARRHGSRLVEAARLGALLDVPEEDRALLGLPPRERARGVG